MRRSIDTARASRQPAKQTRVIAGLAGLVVFTSIAIEVHDVMASSDEGTIDPVGRGPQLLGGREAILLGQSERARRAARARALALYRLLRFTSVERGDAIAAARNNLGGRAVALATFVLERDLGEARVLREELERVRQERTALNVGKIPANGNPEVVAASRPALLRPALLRPVRGRVVTPFGVGRDRDTGAWVFRAAASYAARAAEFVRSPADGLVVRVANSAAGGAAAVLSHDGGDWTSVISGFGSVAVSAGDFVHRGDSLGRAGSVAFGRTAFPIRIEIWRGGTPIDPDSLLQAR